MVGIGQPSRRSRRSSCWATRSSRTTSPSAVRSTREQQASNRGARPARGSPKRPRRWLATSRRREPARWQGHPGWRGGCRRGPERLAGRPDDGPGSRARARRPRPGRPGSVRRWRGRWRRCRAAQARCAPSVLPANSMLRRSWRGSGSRARSARCRWGRRDRRGTGTARHRGAGSSQRQARVALMAGASARRP